MAQRIFIKVVGFSDEERHALNTLFRLSEQCLTMYQLWTPEAPEPPRMALLDAESYESRVEAESPLNIGLNMLWVGADPPAQVWRSFQRPLAWPEVIGAIDAVFQPAGFDLDLDESETQPPAVMSRKVALIVSASRDERLYLRARLALAKLTQADEAESGGEAMVLARGRQYDLAVVDFGLPDMDGWSLLRQLREGKRAITHLAMTKADRSFPERLRAWAGGIEALLGKPPHPSQFDAWLRSL